MKLSCEHNGIEYIFVSSPGQRLNDRYRLLLSKNEIQDIDKGEMSYYGLRIEATKNDVTLVFEIQGIAFHNDAETHAGEIESYIEDHLIFNKIEDKFTQAFKKSKNPAWAK